MGLRVYQKMDSSERELERARRVGNCLEMRLVMLVN